MLIELREPEAHAVIVAVAVIRDLFREEGRGSATADVLDAAHRRLRMAVGDVPPNPIGGPYEVFGSNLSHCDDDGAGDRTARFR